MKSETKTNLYQTRKNLGKCAELLADRKTGTRPLNATEKEMLIGFGTARDWVKWAVALSDVTYSTRQETNSARAQGIVESVRFNQLWTATNALFAKDSILQLAGPNINLPSSEAKRFERLYTFAGVDHQLQAASLETLEKLLGMECKADGVTGNLIPSGVPVMWEIIDQKYMRPEDRARGFGKVISTALAHGKYPAFDGPSIIYGARNWAVHGMLLTSFFRGSKQKYMTFIDNITLLLSAALEGSARNLLSKL